jgi:prolipoprotein diacylglyceryl transferase
MLGTWIGCRRVRLPFWLVADCVAPGLVLAQALGRWGNYANQELYGRPSDLPWAVRIDHPMPPYQPDSSFQPTFLYESLWDLLVFVVLIVFVRRYWRRVALGSVFLLYAALYSLGRAPIETLRIDPADHVLGQRLNFWVALGVCAVAAVALLALLRRGRPAGLRYPVREASRSAEPEAIAGHVPTVRPQAAIESRRRGQRRPHRH